MSQTAPVPCPRREPEPSVPSKMDEKIDGSGRTRVATKFPIFRKASRGEGQGQAKPLASHVGARLGRSDHPKMGEGIDGRAPTYPAHRGDVPDGRCTSISGSRSWKKSVLSCMLGGKNGGGARRHPFFTFASRGQALQVLEIPCRRAPPPFGTSKMQERNDPFPRARAYRDPCTCDVKNGPMHVQFERAPAPGHPFAPCVLDGWNGIGSRPRVGVVRTAMCQTARAMAQARAEAVKTIQDAREKGCSWASARRSKTSSRPKISRPKALAPPPNFQEFLVGARRGRPNHRQCTRKSSARGGRALTNLVPSRWSQRLDARAFRARAPCIEGMITVHSRDGSDGSGLTMLGKRCL